MQGRVSQKRSNVSGQKRSEKHPFLYKNEKCERLAWMPQKRILIKTEQCERGLRVSTFGGWHYLWLNVTYLTFNVYLSFIRRLVSSCVRRQLPGAANERSGDARNCDLTHK